MSKEMKFALPFGTEYFLHKDYDRMSTGVHIGNKNSKYSYCGRSKTDELKRLNTNIIDADDICETCLMRFPEFYPDGDNYDNYKSIVASRNMTELDIDEWIGK